VLRGEFEDNNPAEKIGPIGEKPRMPNRPRSGFTLIEVAIVLVIVGLLLAGVIKGQELMTAARVRNIIQQHDGIRAAYLGFMDRFRQPPGDYAAAVANITGVSTACGAAGNPGGGNGDARVDIAGGEYILAWEHMSKAGFLNGVYNCSGNTVVDASSVPRNPYGGFLQLVYDNVYAGTTRNQHNLKSGNNIPSDILAEMDRKVDDGNALSGSFRGSTYTSGAATDANCWDANSGVWSAAVIVTNCGGAVLY
jgi:prepilin-type N-terminal cleavage/methylation domain-containing protein